MFKRKIAVILASICLFTAIPVQAQTNQVTLKMANQIVNLQQPLQTVNHRTMISLDDLAALVHGKIGKENQIFTLTVNSSVIGFDPHSNEIRIGQHGAPWTKVDQGAIEVSRTSLFVPLRLVLEQLGFQVTYEPATHTVSIDQSGELDVFREVKLEELTAEEKKFVEDNRRIQGVHQLGDLVVIARGEVPNPGHGIQFVKQLGSWEQVRLFVELTRPEPDKMYPQVISYPYLVGKIKLAPYTTLTIVDANTNTILFQNKIN